MSNLITNLGEDLWPSYPSGGTILAVLIIIFILFFIIRYYNSNH